MSSIFHKIRIYNSTSMITLDIDINGTAWQKAEFKLEISYEIFLDK